MFRYHVTCFGSKKIIEIENKLNIESEIRKTFNVDESATVILQVYSSEYGDFVDTKNNEIPDGGKISVLITTSLDISSINTSRPTTSTPKTSTPTTSIPKRQEIPSFNINGPTDDAEENVVTLDTMTKSWPVIFGIRKECLPKRTTEELNLKKPLSNRAYMDILELVYNQATEYTLFPTPQNYSSMVDSILREWPYLITCSALSPSDLKAFWRCKLRWKFTNNRRRKDIKLANEQRRTHGPRNALKKSKSTTAVIAYGIKNYLPTLDSSFNEDIDKEHMETLQKEKRSRKPNIDLVCCLMDQTFTKRRNEIVLRPKPVSEVIQEYPWLHDNAQIVDEYTRLTGTDISTMFTEYVNKYGYAIVKTAQSINDKNPCALQEIYNVISNIDLEIFNNTEKRALYVASYLAVPIIVKEKLEDIIGIEVPVEAPVYIKTTDYTQLIAADTSLEVVCEGSITYHTTNFKQAITAFLAIHYIFNIEYSRKTRKTLMFWEKLVLKLDGNRKRPQELSVINTIANLGV